MPRLRLAAGKADNPALCVDQERVPERSPAACRSSLTLDKLLQERHVLVSSDSSNRCGTSSAAISPFALARNLVFAAVGIVDRVEAGNRVAADSSRAGYLEF